MESLTPIQLFEIELNEAMRKLNESGVEIIFHRKYFPKGEKLEDNSEHALDKFERTVKLKYK